MKRHRIAPFLLVNLLLVSGYGSAQPAPYVLETYDLTRLDARPRRIVVSPDVLTLLEFDGQVGDVSTARPDAIIIEVKGNVIRLRANWTAGNTDLVVTVGNRTAMFTVTVEANGEHTRRYLIRVPEPPIPRSSRTSRSASSSEPITPLGDRARELPDWLSTSFNVLSVPGEEVVIQYGLRNGGQYPLANDALRLKILQENRPVPYTLDRISTGGTINRVKPGYAEYGTILVEEPSEGELTLVWELIEIGPGTAYTLQKDFHDGLLEPSR